MFLRLIVALWSWIVGGTGGHYHTELSRLQRDLIQRLHRERIGASEWLYNNNWPFRRGPRPLGNGIWMIAPRGEGMCMNN